MLKTGSVLFALCFQSQLAFRFASRDDDEQTELELSPSDATLNGPLSYEQCRKAKSVYSAEKTHLVGRSALRDYLKNISEDADILDVVEVQIKKGCYAETQVPPAPLGRSGLHPWGGKGLSPPEPLPPPTPPRFPQASSVPGSKGPLSIEQCLEAKKSCEGKPPMMAEIVVRRYMRDNKINVKLLDAVMEQINGACASESIPASTKSGSDSRSEGPLSAEQCSEAKQIYEAKRSNPMMVQVALTGYMRDKKINVKLLDAAMKQINGACTSESIPASTKSGSDSRSEGPLSAEQCSAAKQIYEAKRSNPMMAQVALTGYMRDNKINVKLLDAAMKQITGTCASESIPASTKSGSDSRSEVSRGRSPAGSYGPEFVNDARFEKYMRMKKMFGEHARGPIEGKITLDKDQLRTEGLTDADLECFLQLLFEETKLCVPAKKLGREFLEDPRFEKYLKMKKFGNPMGAVQGKITMDTDQLLASGLTEDELACLPELLFEMIEECQVGGEKEKKKPLEVQNLEKAEEELADLKSRFNVTPGVPLSEDWLTKAFEAEIPRKGETPKPKARGRKKPGDEGLDFLDSKEQKNLQIVTARLPPPDKYVEIMEHVLKGEAALDLDKLATFGRALAEVGTESLDAVSGSMNKITSKSDRAYQFVKALVPFREQKDDLIQAVDCITKQHDQSEAIQKRRTHLQRSMAFYEEAAPLMRSIAEAASGFLKEILLARTTLSQRGKTGEQWKEYDQMLRKIRATASLEEKAESSAPVPLLVVINVIFDDKGRVNGFLTSSRPDLIHMAPLYSDLFLKYVDSFPEGAASAHALPEECSTLAEKFGKDDPPSFRNSVRGAQQEAVDVIEATRYCLEHAKGNISNAYRTLRTEIDEVLSMAGNVQDDVIRVLREGAPNYLPGNDEIMQFVQKLPKAGTDEDEVRIHGEHGTVAKYRLLDLADDEAFRTALLRVCSKVQEADSRMKKQQKLRKQQEEW